MQLSPKAYRNVLGFMKHSAPLWGALRSSTLKVARTVLLAPATVKKKAWPKGSYFFPVCFLRPRSVLPCLASIADLLGASMIFTIGPTDLRREPPAGLVVRRWRLRCLRDRMAYGSQKAASPVGI